MKNLVAIACAIAFSLSAQAQLPRTLSFQGYLTNDAGEPITTAAGATLDVSFSLYTAKTGGTLAWGPETHQISVDKGIFNTILGASTVTAVPLDFGGSLSFDSKYFLEIIINPGTASAETLSRIELTSSMYSLSTLNATNITSGTLSGALLDEVAASKITGSLAVANGGTGATTSADARTNLGLGSIATQNTGSVAITGGSIIGITDLAIADGGTGASTESTARTNLGLEIGTDVQAWDQALDDISGLAVTDGNIIVGDGINWIAESGSTARASLGLTIGTDVQAYDAGLNSIAGLTTSADQIIYTTAADTYTTSSITLFGRGVLSAANVASFKSTLNMVTGVDLQAYDADLDDLADGFLSGSKIGPGIVADSITSGTLSGSVVTITNINASNLAAGTVPNARLTTHLQDLADGSLTGSKVGTGIVADNISSGTLADARLESTVNVDSLSVDNGGLSVSGFTKLGNSGVTISASSPVGATIAYPSIKVIQINGTTSSSQSGTATVSLSGITDSKIISIEVLVDYGTDDYVHPGFTALGGLHFNFSYQNGVLQVRNIDTESGSILSKPFKAVITYTE